MVSFYKTLGAICEDLRVFFKLSFVPHLGLGKKVVPVYLLNDVFEHQTDSITTIANPTSATLYEWRSGITGAGVNLGTQSSVRIIGIYAKVTWTVQPTPLDLVITVDGKSVKLYVGDPVTATQHQFRCWIAGSTDGLLVAESLTYDKSFILEGRSVKVEGRITGGTVQELTFHVKWAKK